MGINNNAAFVIDSRDLVDDIISTCADLEYIEVKIDQPYLNCPLPNS